MKDDPEVTMPETEDTNIMLSRGGSLSGTGKLVISSGVVLFAIGSIFWAGATYDRIGSIENHLSNLDSKLSAVDAVPVMQRDIADQERRLQKLEDYLRKNP